MNKTLLSLAVIVGMGLSAGVSAEERGMANEAIVGDNAGHVVTDASGDCVRTSAWSEDKANEACGEAQPAPEAVAAITPAPSPISDTITLSAEALFEFDSATFVREQPQLDELAARVKALSSVESVTIVGHTDSVGTDAYNQGLSERRAQAVKDYLVGKDVDPGIIDASGMGESQPVADNASSEGRAQNRRVDITFKGIGAQ